MNQIIEQMLKQYTTTRSMKKGTQFVGIEVVHHQQDNIGIGIILIDKSLQLVRPVFLGSLFLGIHKPVVAQWFIEHEYATGSSPDVFRIFPKGLPLFHWNSLPFVIE